MMKHFHFSRWLLVLLAMLLCLSLGSAIAEELDTNTDTSALHLVTKAEDFVDTFYLEGNYIYNGPIIHLDNYWALHDNVFHHSSYPDFSLSFPNGGEEYFTLSNYSYYGIARVQNWPSEPMTIDAVMHCDWGDMSAEYPFQVHFVEHPNGPLQDIALPATIQTQVGETCIIGIEGFTPANWLLPGAISSTYVGQGNADPFEIIERKNTSCVVQFTEAGVFTRTVNFACANFLTSKSVTFVVADESGKVPGMSPDITVAEMPYDRIFVTDSYAHTNLGSLTVGNWDTMADLFGGEPVWSIQYGSAQMEALISLSTVGRYAVIDLLGAPTEPMTLEATITCSWGNHSEAYAFSMPVVAPDFTLPSIVPDTLECQINTDYVLDMAAWLDAVPDTGNCQQSFYPLDGGQIFTARSNVDGTHTLRPNAEPGEYTVTFGWECANLRVTKDVTVRVTAPGSTEPEDTSEPSLTVDTYSNTIYANGNQPVALGAIFINNLTAMQEAIPDLVVSCDPVTVTGSDFTALASLNDNRISMMLNTQPTVTGKATVLVNCCFSSESSPEIDCVCPCEIEVTVAERPAMMDSTPVVMEPVSAQIGIPFTITYDDIFPFDYSPYTNIGCWLESTVDDMEEVSGNNELYYTARKAGEYELAFRWRVYNVNGLATCSVTVADNGGEMPTPVLSTMDFFNKVLLGGNNNMCLAQVRLDNYDALNAFSTIESAVWSLSTQTDTGCAFEARSYASESCSVMLSAQPETTGEAIITVSCALDFADDALNTTVSQILTVPVEESPVEVDTSTRCLGSVSVAVDELVRVNYDEATNSALLKFDGPIGISRNTDDTALQYLYDEDGYEVFQAKQPGHYTIQYIWEWFNYRGERYMDVTVTAAETGMPELILRDDAVLDTYYIWGGWNYIPVVDLRLENYDDLSAYGTPEWHAEITGDTYGMLGTATPNPDWFWVEVNAVPNIEMDITIKVTCTLGDTTETYTKTLAVRHMDDSTPTSVTLPESLRINAGSRFTLDVSQVNSDRSLLTAENLQFTLSNCQNVFEFVSADGFNYTFKALEPGMYTVQFLWLWHNIAFQPTMTIIVCTEDGELPSCEPEYSVEQKLPTLYTGGNATTVSLADYTLNNLDGLDVLYTLEKITWSAASATHPNYHFSVEKLSGSPCYMLTMPDSPEEAGTMEVTATCTLDFAGDDHDAVITIPLTFTIADVPEGVSAEPYDMGSVHIDVGDEFTFDTAKARRDDLFLSIDGNTASNGVDYNASALSRFATEGEHLYFRALKEGVYRITCRWWWANYVGSSYLTVFVGQDDASAEAPAFEPTCTVYHTELFTGGNVQPVVIQCELANSAELYEMTGGNTYWEVSILGDTEGVLVTRQYGIHTRYCDILLNKVPTRTADITVQITCQNAGMRKTFTTNITISDLGLSDPTITVPSFMVLQVGKLFSVEASDLLNGWEPVGFSPVVEVADDLFELVSVEGDVYTFKPLQSLICDGSLSWQLGNHDHSGRCLFIIKDETGKLPEGLAEHGIGVEPVSTFFTSGTLPTIADIYIHNTAFMAELTGVDQPEWSYEFTGSVVPAVTGTIMENGAEYAVNLNKLITEPCTLTFVVRAKWGDVYTLEVPHEITYVDLGEDTPTGINLPDVLDMQLGDSFSFTVDSVLPGGWDTSNGYPFCRISDDSVLTSFFDQAYIDGGSTYTATTPGIYKFTFSWYCQNLSLDKTVTIRVFDENGALPGPEVAYSTYQIGDGVLYANGTERMLSSVSITNSAYLAALTGVDAPTWSVRQLSGPNAQLYTTTFAYDAVIGADVRMRIDMPEACTISYVLTAAWGDELTKEWEYTVAFIDLGDDRPTAIDMPDSIILSPGESFRLSATAVLPKPWSGTEPMPNVFLMDEPTVSKGFDIAFDRYDIVCTARVPGVYRIETQWMHKNILLAHQFDVLVRDADGNLPLGITAKSTQSRFPICTRWQDVGTAEIPAALYATLHNATGTLPVWSGVIAETGAAVTVTPSADQRTVSISLNGTPATTGSYTVEIAVSWDGMTDTVSLPITVVSASEEIRFAHESYTLPAGMSLEIKPFGPAADCPYKYWSSSNTSAVLDISVCVFETRAPGSAVLTLHLPYEDNTRMVRTLTIHVVESMKTMRLPSLLTEIEAEAFSGTGADYIIIPSGVKTIDNKAFAASNGQLLISIPTSVTHIASDAFAGTDAVILCEAGSHAEAFAVASGLACFLK